MTCMTENLHRHLRFLLKNLDDTSVNDCLHSVPLVVTNVDMMWWFLMGVSLLNVCCFCDISVTTKYTFITNSNACIPGYIHSAGHWARAAGEVRTITTYSGTTSPLTAGKAATAVLRTSSWILSEICHLQWVMNTNWNTWSLTSSLPSVLSAFK